MNKSSFPKCATCKYWMVYKPENRHTASRGLCGKLLVAKDLSIGMRFVNTPTLVSSDLFAGAGVTPVARDTVGFTTEDSFGCVYHESFSAHNCVKTIGSTVGTCKDDGYGGFIFSIRDPSESNDYMEMEVDYCPVCGEESPAHKERSKK